MSLIWWIGSILDVNNPFVGCLLASFILFTFSIFLTKKKEKLDFRGIGLTPPEFLPLHILLGTLNGHVVWKGNHLMESLGFNSQKEKKIQIQYPKNLNTRWGVGGLM